MLLKETIAKAYHDQQRLINRAVDREIPRIYPEYLNEDATHIQVIAGIRRCGKSTLLRHLMQNMERPAYFNFEDSRVYGFELADFEKLDDIMGREVEAYCFDEVQNVTGWEVFIRQLHERGEQLYITGSNASLLSRELGTRLTGRYIKHELFPFSYPEFLQYQQQTEGPESMQDYLHLGGFPEYLYSGRLEILQQLFKDILFRDIAVRHGIRNTDTLMQLALFLLSNPGKEHTFNSLRKAFDIGSVNTVSDFFSWLEDAYLVQSLARFSWSAKKRNVNPRKVYAIDTGLARANSLSFTEDRGRLLENAVFLHLRRQPLDTYYFREKKECDFVVFQGQQCRMAIQVTEHLHEGNLDREVAGLLEAARQFGIPEGHIVTLGQEDRLDKDGIRILIIPAHVFLSKDLPVE